jgi:phage terminase large subunit-like protein
MAKLKRPEPRPFVISVPNDDGLAYPTLGPLVCGWMEDNLVFGPGDLRGEPLVLDDEQRAFIFRFYELFPEGHPEAGRRRFRRCALSIAKGLRKTELAAFVAAAELSRDSPVRFDGWDGKGVPKGRPVTDPFVVMVAYTEEQSDELAYGALRTILAESPIADQFDIGLERIMRIGGDGKAVSLAGSPNARDGARTTFSLFDETHWHTLEKLKKAHQVMMANLPKRKLADPWALEVTTAYEPGSGSIAESTMEYARAISEGRSSKPEDTKLFFYHRQASDEHDLETEDGARAAAIEASGSCAEWRDIEGIVSLWRDPTTDRQYWERVWCNRPVQSAKKAFDVAAFKSLAKPQTIKDGATIVLGFDGAQFRDATALVATHVPTGYQWLAGAWECPYGAQNWQVPVEEVDTCVDELFDRYHVWRMYADPPYWQSWIAAWQGRYGDKRVIEWWTNRRSQIAAALESFETAIREKSFSHDGNELYARHIGNAHRQDLPMHDDENKPRWMIRKERSDSPRKIDAAMAGVLSWEARKDAIASGVGEEPVYPVPLDRIVERLDTRTH